MGFKTSVAILVLLLLAPALPGQAPPPPAETVVLDTFSFWRQFHTFGRPLVLKESGIEPVSTKSKWLDRETAAPPADWTRPDFDDSSWARSFGILIGPWWRAGVDSPMTAFECRRGKFTVTDPGLVKDLTLSVTYVGGAVIRLNGKEVARANMSTLKGPDGEALAEAYPPEAPAKPELRQRKLEAKVPAGSLRKGVNVLALEIHRAPYRETDILPDKRGHLVNVPWGSCRLMSVKLGAPTADGLIPNVSRPKGFQVWNSDVNAADFDLDYGDPNEPLRPISIVGTPGGTFSGKVVVGSDTPIKELRAQAGDLKAVKGNGAIPASAVEVRYAAVPSTEEGQAVRYPASNRFDALLEKAPAEVPVAKKNTSRLAKGVPAPVFGAVVPIWVTVHVPAGASPGEYRGKLTISYVAQPPSAGIPQEDAQARAPVPHQPIEVPVIVKVCGWKLPPPAEWRTFMEFVESPDTLALEYNVPLWSEKHFALIDQSLRLLGQVGNRTAYVPLICESNLGNAESMVRRVRKPDGSYSFDFAAMDRCLDLVEKNQGKPAVVAFVVWDTFLEGGTQEVQYMPPEVKKDREENADKGPEVTLVDPATGRTESMQLPKFADPAARALWQPLIEQVHERMKKRGLETAMTFGFGTDSIPPKHVVTLFNELAPGTPWMRAAHGSGDKYYGVPVAYSAHVWGCRFAVDPADGRILGWKTSGLLVQFVRNRIETFPLATHRLVAEMNIAGSQRGVGRLGGDFWPVLKNKKGDRVGRLCEGRYPKSSWRALNIVTAYLAPGPDGPVATARLELVREGVEECEARIFIEKALSDPALRAKLGDDLAKRAQTLLDERTVSILRGTCSFILGEHFTNNAADNHCWWHLPGLLGQFWYQSSGWQERSERLFTAAAEVERAVGK